MDCSLPGFSVHDIFQARMLEWVALSFSRWSSRPRKQTLVSCTAGRFFPNWATREVHSTDRVVVTMVTHNSCLFAEHQLYVRDRDNDIHMLVGTSVTVSIEVGTGWWRDSDPQPHLISPAWSQAQGTSECLLTPLWSWLGRVDCFLRLSLEFSHHKGNRAPMRADA